MKVAFDPACCGGESLQDAMAQVAPDAGRPLRYQWRPLAGEVQERLGAVLASWRGTPYVAGQRARGAGADCVQLVAGVLDELYRRTSPTSVARLGPDSGIHSLRAGMRTALNLRHGYPCQVVRDRVLEPGDVIVTRATADARGPVRLGHALILGISPGTAWHAIPGPGVTQTSVAGRDIVRIYRPCHKDSWALGAQGGPAC